MNLSLHILRGNTLIEVKFIYKNGEIRTNPYNLGMYRNLLFTFGNFGYGLSWILPLPPLMDKESSPDEKLGLTYYPMNPEFVRISQ
jgi:hypothetical protein